MLKNNDSKGIWNTVNWKGKITNDQSSDTASVAKFKLHFEKLLNPAYSQMINLTTLQDCPYMSIMDDPLTPLEVDEGIETIIPKRSGASSSIQPRILKLLPSHSIIFLASFFNGVFVFVNYPPSWVMAHLFGIFKKESRASCDNTSISEFSFLSDSASLPEI